MPLEYSQNALFKSCTSLSSSPCHPARHVLTLGQSVLHTQSLPSPLTLCLWPAVPFTLIKTTKAPPSSVPFSHTPLPSALITEPSVLLIGVISSSNPPSLFHSHLWEVCRRDRGHCLWRADVHRVPQRGYKEVRKRTRGTSSSVSASSLHLHCNSY